MNVLLRCCLLALCSSVFLLACQPDPEGNKPRPGGADGQRAAESAAQDHLPFEVLDIYEGRYEQGPALVVAWSRPVDPRQNLERLIQVLTADDEMIKGSWILDTGGREAYFTSIEPETTYQVGISKQLRSVGQKQLGKEHVAKVETRKIQPMVAFAESGYLLVDDIARGLPVVTVNVDQVNVDYYRLPKEALHQLWGYMQVDKVWAYMAQRLTENAVLAYSARYDLDPPKNRVHRVNLPVLSIDQLAEPGLYMALMRPPSDYGESYQFTLFVQTDLGLHLRKYPQHWDLWVKSIKKARSIDGAQVSVIDAEGTLIGQAQTDQDGFARLPAFANNDKPAVLLVEKRGDSNLLALNQPALDLSEFATGDAPTRRQTAFFYGPRDLYRPGEMLELRMLLRDSAGQFASEFEGLAPKTQIIRPDGKVVKEFVWQPEGQGYYRLDWPIAADAYRGSWWVRVELPDASKQHRFDVQDFQPETMHLTLSHHENADWPLFADDQELLIDMKAVYLYGSPARGRLVGGLNLPSPLVQPFSALADLGTAPPEILSLREYIFGQPFDVEDLDPESLPEGHLDDEGRFQYRIASHWQGKNAALLLRTQLSVTEGNGQPLTRLLNAVIWPRDKSLLGVRLEGIDDVPANPDDLVTVSADSALPIEIIKVNAKGEPQVAPLVRVTLEREKTEYFWVHNPSRGWHWQSSSRLLKVFEESVELGAGMEPARLSLPIGWGNYTLTLEEPGMDVITRVPLTTGHYGLSDGVSNKPDRVEIGLDKESYRPGEIARVQVVPPAAGPALVLVETDRALWRRSLKLPVTGALVEIPLDPDWSGSGIYVSAVLFQPGADHAAQPNQATPIRAIGLVPLAIDRSAQQLNISLETSEQWRSEASVSVTATVEGIDPAQDDSATWVTLAVVDEGVLAVSDYLTPDPFAQVFAHQRYQVSIQDVYHQLIAAAEGGLARQRFGGDVQLLKVSALRMRGSDTASMSGQRVLAEDRLFSVFLERVQVDAQGQARFDLTLPNYVGQARIMALAFNDRQLGHGDSAVTVQTPLIHRLQQPAYLAMTDRSHAVVMLQNLTENSLSLELTAETSGPLLLPDTAKSGNGWTRRWRQSLSLEPDLQHYEFLPLRAEREVGVADLSIKVTSADGDIRSVQKKRVSISSAYPPVRRAERVAIAAGKGHRFEPDTDGLLMASLSGTLALSGSLPFDMAEQADRLLYYQYGCVEQTVSTAWPWLSEPDRLYDLLVERADPPPADKAQEVQDRLDEAVLSLLDRQKHNGGFALWRSAGDESTYTSVYATDFLLRASQQGIAVPEQALERAQGRLQYYLQRRGDLWMVTGLLDAPGHYALATRAYAAYVLARENRVGLSEIRQLVEQKVEGTSGPLPVAHLAAALKLQGDPDGAERLWASLPQHSRASHYLGDYGSDVRDYAAIAQLGLAHGFGYADPMAELTDALHRHQWLQTQERAMLYVLGAGLEQISPQTTTWQARMTSDGGQPAELTGSEDETFELGGDVIARGFHLAHLDKPKGLQTPLYASFNLVAFPKQGPKMDAPALDDQIVVEKTYRDHLGRPLDIGQLRMGQPVLVDIRLLATGERVADALVVDLIPAGLQLENPNLSHSLDMDDMRIDGVLVREIIQAGAEFHREHRRDRFVASGVLAKGEAVRLIYAARATTKGQYLVGPVQVESMYRPQIRGASAGLPAMVVSH